MPEVEVYTTPVCPYCSAAKELLRRKGVPFLEIDVAGEPQRRAEMVARANGRTTVPQSSSATRILAVATTSTPSTTRANSIGY
jgi:glutaredoxin